MAACRPARDPAADRPVAVVEVTTRTDQVQATGTVKPQVGAEVKVGPRISGTVKRLNAHVGQFVQAGAILAEIESSDLEATLAQARADREEAEVAHRLAQESFHRLSALGKNGLVSQENLREAELAELSAAAALRKARAAEQSARIQLSYATIRAPTSGTVASISTQTGETVAASLASPTFVTIIDLARLQVIAYVDEVDIERVKIGQPVTFTADAVPDREFHGTITAINPAARVRENVVSFEVVTSIADDSDRVLRPEMSVSVTIVTGSPRQALTIPADAVQHSGNSAFVEVLQADGTSRKQTVDAGRDEGGRVEIRNGLTAGQRVVRVPRDQKAEH
jgi:macrolide-specific efflux system membrane fusion protein